MSLPSDECGTPAWLAAFAAARWGAPDLDVAACEEFHLAPRYFSREEDALAEGRAWTGDVVIGNPPYSPKARNGVRDYLKDFTARGRRALDSGEVRRAMVWIVPDTQAVGWWRRNLVSAEARSVQLRERVVLKEGVTGWLDVYRDGPYRVEVVSGFGRVAFARPGQTAEAWATGKTDTALVALIREQPQGRVTELRPFFSYYGGKWRDALHYPPPEHDIIVEPFAGAAGYSLRYPGRRVILCEIDPVIAEVWRYLIRVAAREVLAIPDVRPGGSTDDLKVNQEAKWLVGLWLNRAAARPCRTPSKWMRDGIRPGSFWGARVRQVIASQVEAIRHWKVFACDYRACPTPQVATWFVDPPYRAAGKHYRFGSDRLDYKALGEWCSSRPGQVIVCENEGASWLPFRGLAEVKTTRVGRRSSEVVWLSAEQSREQAEDVAVPPLGAQGRLFT